MAQTEKCQPSKFGVLEFHKQLYSVWVFLNFYCRIVRDFSKPEHGHCQAVLENFGAVLFFRKLQPWAYLSRKYCRSGDDWPQQPSAPGDSHQPLDSRMNPLSVFVSIWCFVHTTSELGYTVWNLVPQWCWRVYNPQMHHSWSDDVIAPPLTGPKTYMAVGSRGLRSTELNQRFFLLVLGTHGRWQWVLRMENHCTREQRRVNTAGLRTQKQT